MHGKAISNDAPPFPALPPVCVPSQFPSSYVLLAPARPPAVSTTPVPLIVPYNTRANPPAPPPPPPPPQAFVPLPSTPAPPFPPETSIYVLPFTVVISFAE